jgi:hypothetical protein
MNDNIYIDIASKLQFNLYPFINQLRKIVPKNMSRHSSYIFHIPPEKNYHRYFNSIDNETLSLKGEVKIK